MKSKTPFSGPLFEAIDRITKALVFQFLFLVTVLFSLGIFTVVGLIILVLAMKSLQERQDSIVKTWITNLKKYTKSVLPISLLFSLLFLLFVFNTIYFALAYFETTLTIHAIFAFVNGIVVMYVIKVLHHYIMIYIYLPRLTGKRRLFYAVQMPFVMMFPTIVSAVLGLLSLWLVIWMPLLLIIIYPLIEIAVFFRMTQPLYQRLLLPSDTPLRFDGLNHNERNNA